MFTTGILADIWNVVDFGIEESLDRIQSLGAQSISLRVTSSRVSQLRAGELEAPRIFRNDGGYFFQPDKSKYSNTRIKPVVASWLKSRDPLERITESCKKRDLELRLRIDALEQPVIARRYPDSSAKTVWGDLSETMLSASNPDVVELLRATAIDLSQRCEPAGIEIAKPRSSCGAYTGEGISSGFCEGCGFRELMDLSFDESSKQSAIARDVDVEATIRWVTVSLKRVLENGASLEPFLRDLVKVTPVLEAYVNSQIADLTKLVERTAAAADCPISIVLADGIEFGLCPNVACDSLSHDRGVILETYLGGQDQFITSDDVFGSMKFPGVKLLPSSHTARQIRMSSLDEEAPEELVSKVKQFADDRVGGVIIASFGLIAPPTYETVKQAFRFASRSSH